jgi:hypothetical protein
VSGVIRAGKTQARHRRRADPLQWDPRLPGYDSFSRYKAALSGAKRMDLPVFLIKQYFFDDQSFSLQKKIKK